MSPFSAFRGWLQDLPIRKKLSLLVGILVMNILAVVSIGVLGFSVLSSVRAYVGGEGLWAKSQKNAIYSLSRYAVSLHESDYLDYLEQLRTPLGDRRARQELSKPAPDLALSDAALLEGGNHPDDVRGMALLLLRFHRFGPIRRAIGIWSEADGVLVELQDLGRQFHDAALRGRPGPAQTAAFIGRLEALNDRLTVLENAFSASMGEAARAAKSLLARVMVACSLLIGLLSVAIALLLSRDIAENVTRISAAASRAAQGDLGVRVEARGKDELGQLAEAFNAMTEGLERIERLKGEFISNVSHELRTPLTLNLAPLEALLEGDYGPVPEAQLRVLGVMRNNLVRLLQMVNGLLDFSKLEAGKMQVHREATDLAALTRSVLQDFRPAMDAKGLAVDLELEAAEPPVLMDRYLFERILFNLLSNAVKFTPGGGKVSVGLRLAGASLELTVADSGIGISKEEAKGLFKKFSQAEASSTRRFEGTGLGLALVKECAQLLDGSVDVESEPGKGSRFRVRCAAPPVDGPDRPLPLAPRRAVPAPLTAAPGGPASAEPGRPRVLVAEDNPELAEFITELLAPLCEVRVRGDGAEALQELRRWRPDLLLSDVMMPGMDGIALTREVKRSAETGAIPVVLLTALTSREALLRGWEAGADDYLFKPFHPRELQSRVRTLLALVSWRRRSEEHRQREEILGQFARIASHDLKAPLRTMAGYAGLLMKEAGEGLSEEGRRCIQVILESAGRMHGMIEALVRYVHLEPGADGYGVCDLNQVLKNVEDFLAPALGEAGAVLDIGPLPTLPAVPEHVFAVFQNLIGNSLKYRQPGRPLRVSVRAVELEREWRLSVADNGRGFDPSQSEAVFTLFRRLHSSEEQPGDGMGLAIVKKIVENHGGKIWVEARPELGATFHFTLPKERSPAALAA